MKDHVLYNETGQKNPYRIRGPHIAIMNAYTMYRMYRDEQVEQAGCTCNSFIWKIK